MMMMMMTMNDDDDAHDAGAGSARRGEGAAWWWWWWWSSSYIYTHTAERHRCGTHCARAVGAWDARWDSRARAHAATGDDERERGAIEDDGRARARGGGDVCDE